MRCNRYLDPLVYFAVRVFVCIVQSLRIETCETVAEWLAFVAVDVLGVRQRVVDENLKHVFPNLDASQRKQISREMWRHLALMVCETALVPRKIHRTNWRQHVRIDGRREFVRLLLDPRPTLIVSGHFGNFEVGGFMTGLLGFPTYTVARRLDNQALDAYVNRFRSANGQFIVPKEDSAQQLDQLLARGATLTLLGDQHAGQKGCWVDFFGRPASCHKAIALFSMTSKAPMLVSYSKRAGRPLQFELGLAGVVDPDDCDEDLLGVRPLTQWYNQRLEELVRRSPEQYWWLHRRWKEAPRRLVRRSRESPRAA